MEKFPIILYPSKVKYAFLILVSLAFIILGFTLIDDNIWIAIFNIVFFGSCLITFIINMIPNSSYLKIDEKGIEMKNLHRSTFISWSVVSGFDTKTIFINKQVTFDIDENFLICSNFDTKKGTFPDTYGMSAKELAATLNKFKNQVHQSRKIKF